MPYAPLHPHWLNACWHRTWRQALLLVLLAACLPAWALQDFVQKRSFLVDPDGRMTIEEVHSHKGFQPIAGPLARGYTDSVTWLRLEVAPTQLMFLALVVQTSYLDDLQLYSPKRFEPGWLVQQAGDRFAQSQREIPQINTAFRVSSETGEPTVHYLRLKTTSASLMHVRAMAMTDMMTFDTLLHAVVGAYVGLIAVLLFFSLICWRLTGDRLWGLDALLQTSTLFFTFFNMGFAARYLFSDHPAMADNGVSVMSCVQLSVASLFFWQLFKAYNAPGWATLLYRFSLLVLPGLLLLIASGNPQAAVAMNANLLLAQTLVGAVAIWFVQFSDALLRRLVRFMYIALLIYLLVYTLPLLGLAQATEFNLYPALVGNLLTSVMLQFVLWRRTQLQLRERWKWRVQMVEAREKLKSETERREEATSFLTMLMHEIKSPLGAIRVATQTLVSGRMVEPDAQASRLGSIQQAVAGIDAVLERCIEVDRLDQGALAIQKKPHDVAALLAQWVAAEPEQSRIQLARPERLTAQVDAHLLGMMVRNLIGNALAYSPDGSDITVSLTQGSPTNGSAAAEAGFTVAVRNAVGRCGAPDPARVFEKYYRAPNAHHITGTGFGLYWVRSVAQLMGGSVQYRMGGQPLGEQVVFELWLPC